MKPMKRPICFLVALMLLFPLAGCNKKNNDIIRIILDWTPNTNHTGLYVALELGYYSDAGLIVEIQQPPEEGALSLLAAGNAEYAVSFQESFGPAIAGENPLPVTAVAAIISHNTSGIVSLSETGITRPAELAGKRYATWGTALVDAVLRDIVEGDGGSFDDIAMVYNNVTDVVSALESDVDAAWIYYAWDGIYLELRGIGVNYIDLKEVNPVFDYYTPILVASDSYAEANPDDVTLFMEATARGYEYAIANPEEAAAILLKYAPELDEALVVASQQYLAAYYRDDVPYWGYIDGDRWNAFYAWMYEQDLLERDLQDTGYTNQYLPQDKAA